MDCSNVKLAAAEPMAANAALDGAGFCVLVVVQLMMEGERIGGITENGDIAQAVDGANEAGCVEGAIEGGEVLGNNESVYLMFVKFVSGVHNPST